MTYTAYLNNIQAQTGKTAEWFRTEAAKRGLTTHAELLRWLKADCGLGHGHANAIILYVRHTALAKRKLTAEAKDKSKRAGSA